MKHKQKALLLQDEIHESEFDAFKSVERDYLVTPTRNSQSLKNDRQIKVINQKKLIYN